MEMISNFFTSNTYGPLALTSGFVILIGVGFYFFNRLTRSGIIARAVCKEAIRQPIFWLLLGITILGLLLNTFLPFFTFKEDVKLLKDCGLATILICGLLLTIWTLSQSISEEIEGKTAMTLLSKPINRRQFILGKYFGNLQAALFFLIPSMIIFLLLVFYKVGYDARETRVPVELAAKLKVTTQVIPGIALIFLEIAVLSAISVAISVRLPMLVNMITCLTIFVVGHLTPLLVKTQIIQIEFVYFMARLISTVLPSLEIFNIQAAVATNIQIPADYLGFALLYTVVYCTAILLLAFILFEDRDLA